MEQAIESVKEFIADIDSSEQEYYESFQIAMQLREQVVEALAPHDPEMALNFLRATRTLSPPEFVQVGPRGTRKFNSNSYWPVKSSPRIRSGRFKWLRTRSRTAPHRA